MGDDGFVLFSSIYAFPYKPFIYSNRIKYRKNTSPIVTHDNSPAPPTCYVGDAFRRDASPVVTHRHPRIEMQPELTSS